MHRLVAGTCQMELRLQPRSPWFVPSAQDNNDTRKLRSGSRPVLPASSLKGVLRSGAERILRGMEPNRDLAAVPLADNPFALVPEDELPSRKRGEITDGQLRAWRDAKGHDTLPAAGVFAALSPISQLFGTTVHAGLLTFDDYRGQSVDFETRPHAPLDRFTGATHNLFVEYPNAAATALTTSLTITNFALWQIALLALVFQEMNRGYLGIGGGTRKGLGRVEATVTGLTARYADWAYAGVPGGSGIVSAQARLSGLQRATQGVPAAVADERDIPPLLPHLTPVDQSGEWWTAGTTKLIVPAAEVPELLRACVEQAWVPWLERMRAQPTGAADAATA